MDSRQLRVVALLGHCRRRYIDGERLKDRRSDPVQYLWLHKDSKKSSHCSDAANSPSSRVSFSAWAAFQIHMIRNIPRNRVIPSTT